MSRPIPRTLIMVSTLVAALALTGCAGQSVRHNSSSVVSFLYSDKNKPVETATVPRLTLPLRVGVAFVPDYSRDNSFTEQQKMELLRKVGAHFEQQNFVSTIEIIPSAYLRAGGGFDNLDQISTMHGIDVIALVSYDQKQFTDEGLASIAYWTLIGAYIIPGEKNDTHTMVDAVVYDIDSRKMLFRAPGISHIKGVATPVNLSEQLREDSLKGFQSASDDLMVNLDEQLQLFRERVKQQPQDYQIIRGAGYTGGGSLDGGFVLISLSLLGGLAVVRGRMA